MEKWESQPHNLAYQKGVDFCFWPEAAIGFAENHANRIAALRAEAAVARLAQFYTEKGRVNVFDQQSH